MAKRILSLILALLTALSLFVPAYADGPAATEQPAITSAPEATEVPAVPSEPPAPQLPDPTAEPQTEEAPAATAEPIVTPEPQATSAPVAAAAPAAADGPSLIGADTAAPFSVGTAGKDFANVVLFVYFNDQQNDYFTDPAKAKKLYDIYNGSYGRSFTNYLRTISYGQFEVLNVIPQYDSASQTIRAVQVPYSTSQALGGNIDSGIIEAALQGVSLDSSCIDLNADGFIDNVTIVMQGGSGETESGSVSYHAHKSDYPGTMTVSGKHIGTYNMLSTYRLADQTVPAGSGVAIHEFLHSLGYPDLYTAHGTDYPVGFWDIMSTASMYPSWPLAYLRMKCTNWVQLKTVTETATLTLSDPSVSGGDQAFIIRSPLNEHELFVVEMRRRNAADILAMNTLDSKISLKMQEGEAGLIVYRVDTTVDGLSNYHGKTGIYVFRPDPTAADQKQNIQDAFLSPSSGRTSIGTADMSKGLADGALTFTDGTNSGIVIRNVAVSGSNMVCEVVIPSEGSYDLWNDTGFADTPDVNDGTRSVAMTSCQGRQYMVTCTNNTFTLYRFDGTVWTQLGAPWKENASRGTEMVLTSSSGRLYLGYLNASYQLRIKSFDLAAGAWTDAALHTGTHNAFAMTAVNGVLYIVYDESNTRGRMLRLNGSTLEDMGTYFTGSGGQPQITTVGSVIYVSFRTAGNNVEVFRCNGPQSFTKVSNVPITANTYGMLGIGSQLKVVAAGAQITVYSYDGRGWTAGKPSNLSCFDPKLASVNGFLYMLASTLSGDGYIYVYRYNPISDTWTREGEQVDATAQQITLSVSGDQLFISYMRSMDRSFHIRRKTIVNELESISVTPPTKTVYVQDEAVSTAGMTVTAHYSGGGGQLLAPGEYAVTGFDTATLGSRSATVTYRGKTASFTYQVQAPSPKTLPAPKLTAATNAANGAAIVWGAVSGAPKYRVLYRIGSGPWTALAETTSTSYTWTGAQSGVKYAFTVQCVTSDGKNPLSPYDETGKVLTYIAAPKLTALNNTAKGVTLSWTKSAGAVKYRVLYRTGSGSWKKLADTTAAGYTWTKPKAGTVYGFTVQCISKNGKSTVSAYDPNGRTITYVPTPKTPSLSNAVNGVKISWSKVTGAVNYRVYYKTGSGAWTALTTTAASYIWTGAQSGTKYAFTVQGLSADGSASAYNTSGKSITFLAPPAISGLANTASGVSVSWNKVAGAAKYRVFYKTGSGGWKKLADTTSTSYTWKKGKSGTTYSFTVRCIDAKGKSYTSDYDPNGRTIQYVAAPSIPSLSSTTGGMKISWSKVTGAVNYRIYYKTGSGAWAPLTTTTSTSYTWPGAQSGVSYAFTVQCVSADGATAVSGYNAAGRTGTFIAAPVITGLTNTASGVTLSWAKPAGAVKYRVFYRTGSGSWKKLGDTTATSYTWKKGKSGTTYAFTVRCIDSKGKSYTSDYDPNGRIITYVAAPKAPSLSNTTGGVRISWSSVKGATNYRVYYKTDSGAWTALGSTTATSYIWAGAQSGVKYAFTVQCVGADGSTAVSGYNASGRTGTFLSAPVISGLANTASGVSVSWNTVPGAAKYRVFYKTGKGGWKKLGDTTSTSYTWKSAKSGTTYAFTVRCIDAKGRSYTSDYDPNGRSIQYVAAPKIPSLSCTAGGMKISWSKVTGAVNYRVYYKTGSGAWAPLAATTSTSYIWPGAQSGVSYAFTVQCVSADGATAVSGYNAAGRTGTFIAAPVITGLTNTASGVTLSWAKPAGAVKYRVFYRTGSGSWKKLGDTTAASYTWKSAKNGATYSFTVQCVTANGKSAASGYDSTGRSITYYK